MPAREASCHCGQLRLTVEGEPRRVSMCSCTACQRRTGSAFGIQAGFDAVKVEIDGRFHDYARISDEADRREHVFHFCPECGSSVFYTEPDEPDLVVVSVGAFGDPSFPAPVEAGYDSRRYPWVSLPDSIRLGAAELWDPARPLYEAGRYAEAADLGLEIVAERDDQPYLFFNLACCEALAGRTTHAIGHLGQAIAMWDGCREMARTDPDFDPIRAEPAFQALVGRATTTGQ